MDARATFSCSLTQCDLGPLAELPSLPPWPAQRLLPQERQDLAVQVLAGAQPVSDLAREHEVSRKFLYQQAHTAQAALTQAFEPDPKTEKVLFHLPVTKAWLRQLVLGSVLIGHSPYRAVVELLRDLFDWRISLGTVHTIVSSAVEPARAINCGRNLGGVHIGAHDEIFQTGPPVLVGVDTASTYWRIAPMMPCSTPSGVSGSSRPRGGTAGGGASSRPEVPPSSCIWLAAPVVRPLHWPTM